MDPDSVVVSEILRLVHSLDATLVPSLRRQAWVRVRVVLDEQPEAHALRLVTAPRS